MASVVIGIEPKSAPIGGYSRDCCGQLYRGMARAR